MGQGREVAARIGRLGAWSFALQAHPAAREQEAVRELGGLGYGAVWVPESLGSKEVFAHAGLLLAAGSDAVVATGIASIWARDAMAMSAGSKALAEAYPGRFLLGIGVSHRASVASRGSVYGKPVPAMRSYLDAMDDAEYAGPPTSAPRVLAALGPKMLSLAAERADGAHTYFVPVDHTPRASEELGPEPALAVEQAAVLSSDPSDARRVARAFVSRYLRFPNYANNLRRLGFSEDDVSNEGSDRLVDAVVAWGDVDAIAGRVRQHWDAGADHVAVQFRAEDPNDLCLGQFRELAAELLPGSA